MRHPRHAGHHHAQGHPSSPLYPRRTGVISWLRDEFTPGQSTNGRGRLITWFHSPTVNIRGGCRLQDAREVCVHVCVHKAYRDKTVLYTCFNF